MSALTKIRKSLKKLKDVNTVTEHFEIDDIKFEITVLTRQEEIDAQSWADQMTDGLSHVLRMDVARLSYAIKKIDGVSMEEFVVDPETQDRLQRHIFLREALMDLPSPLLDVLITKHNKARSELREKLGMAKISLNSIVEQAQLVEAQARAFEKQNNQNLNIPELDLSEIEGIDNILDEDDEE